MSPSKVALEDDPADIAITTSLASTAYHRRTQQSITYDSHSDIVDEALDDVLHTFKVLIQNLARQRANHEKTDTIQSKHIYESYHQLTSGSQNKRLIELLKLVGSMFLGISAREFVNAIANGSSSLNIAFFVCGIAGITFIAISYSRKR